MIEKNLDVLNFTSVKSLVESGYPMPIATVFRRCRIKGDQDLGGRHRNIIDIFEIFIKFICLVQLQELRLIVPNFKERLPQKEKTLEFLKRPSLGSWISLLRILTKIDVDSSRSRWSHKISEWYRQDKNPKNLAVLLLFDGIKGVSFDSKTKSPNAEICNAFVTYRNKQLAHGANIKDEELEKRLPILESIIAYLLKSATFLNEMLLFVTNRIEVAENNQWLIHAQKLSGISNEPTRYYYSNKIELSEIYMISRDEEKIDEIPIPLSPFMLWQVNEETKNYEIYFYNDAWRTKLEYVSYSSGSYYYHKELHSGFKDIIVIKLKPGEEEDQYRALSQEERSNRAEELYKRAILLKSKEKFEEALETLEVAAEYERRADIFLEMATIQKALKDSGESIMQTLQNCLDIEPNNQQALDFQNTLLKYDKDEVDYPGKESESFIEHPTIWHILTPRIIRGHAMIWWISWPLSWYLFSAIIEYQTKNPEKIILNVFQFITCTVGFIGLLFGRSVVHKLKVPLSLQLDTMRLERFYSWFENQMSFIFGSYRFNADKLDIRGSFKSEKAYYYGWLSVFFAISVIGIIITEIYKLPPLLFLKRYIDNIIVLGFGATPFLRYMITTTLFIFRFSKLSLKPMLTKINDHGLRAFGPFLTYNISLISITWFTLVVYGSQEIIMASRIDIFLWIIPLLLIYVWSIGMPVAIGRSAREAKSKAINMYSEHIEKSFDSFLKEPTEDSLQRYNWLLKNQETIKKISTWPLSLSETFFVIIGSNLLVTGTYIGYVITRLEYWPSILKWFNQF